MILIRAGKIEIKSDRQILKEVKEMKRFSVGSRWLVGSASFIQSPKWVTEEELKRLSQSVEYTVYAMR